MDPEAQEDEQPQHQVYLPEYQIARVPVTNRQFAQFVEATNYQTDVEQHVMMTAMQIVRNCSWHYPDGRGSGTSVAKEDHSVIWVSWRDAQAFCRWARVRLPSEAEWEKAARGTDGRLYPWGNRSPDKTLYNYDRYVKDLTSVGQYPAGASPYGVLDMAGYKLEWTNSSYKTYPYRMDDGREGPDDGERVLRGSTYWTGPWQARSASRHRHLPYIGHWDFSFRVAMSSSVYDSGS